MLAMCDQNGPRPIFRCSDLKNYHLPYTRTTQTHSVSNPLTTVTSRYLSIIHPEVDSHRIESPARHEPETWRAKELIKPYLSPELK